MDTARAAEGLAALSLAGELTSVARSHSRVMADATHLPHNPALGSAVRGWQKVGENVGRGHSESPRVLRRLPPPQAASAHQPVAAAGAEPEPEGHPVSQHPLALDRTTLLLARRAAHERGALRGRPRGARDRRVPGPLTGCSREHAVRAGMPTTGNDRPPCDDGDHQRLPVA